MRLLEIVIAREAKEALDKLLDSEEVIEKWVSETVEEGYAIKVLTQDEYAKELLNSLENRQHCRVIIHAVEGTLPKPDVPEKEKEAKVRIGKFVALSKEELYSDIDEPVKLSLNFILMVILSSFVAGIGILKDNVAIIIGAMVIAPFLGPNMSMAFGTTLGDWPVIKKSMVTGIVSSLIALVISVLWGMLAGNVGEITMDPGIAYDDIVLALACGFAGVISALSGQGGTLVGVMVAAALLPPLMRAGLLLGGEYYSDAFNSFLIFCTNIICLNIAGIITFYLAGIRPGRWWEKENAKKKTRTAFLIWSLALALIIITILLLRKFEFSTRVMPGN
ncbi:TIGR00341 family protein [Sinomicrobium weinanense]|uniref:TIGR00341 family protein n=1 Tax=Sinomicrobium weinanense TaxID=2842200 RepID=A0A926Q3K4_9FLAO|nr:TIGR00341 family protein [Sinomicrobium weinanense]MBC9797677.1 TIGR00341 family protein [Sinomicrobium weinanense]MBU3125794.1 TIGR00341 family protein [Sinomicrobium weinanense]